MDFDAFVEYYQSLSGDEKGEAQVFLDRLFIAFGHKGYKEAGAELEMRIRRKGESTRFADLLWKSRVLIEMKKRGEKLEKHYRQAFDYWIHLVPNRPTYVILCNFDEFWIYDFNQQVDEPMDKVKTVDLKRRWRSMSLMTPVGLAPLFENNLVEVTRKSAELITDVFRSMLMRGEDRVRAQRFLMQMVVAMFSEDANLLPKGLFTTLVRECGKGKESSYDLLGGLFSQMNNPIAARAGRFVGVRYFNGGLFADIDPIELTDFELLKLRTAADEDWSRVQPQIFGVLFQHSMGKEKQHKQGAHFTSEADIQKIVGPTIVRPWRERIDNAKSQKELMNLLDELRKFKVLDPACGSGNFLYVAYREMKRLETSILERLHTEFQDGLKSVGTESRVSIKQFFGIDLDPFAVEVAKVTLMIAKELALMETTHDFATQNDLGIAIEEPLPLDNLNENIVAKDALLEPWPEVEVIIGNPPFQSKNKMQQEFGPAYVQKIRTAFPEIPGRADFCVYWFRKAHDQLKNGQRAGLVGTNTISQNYSRKGGLDFIVNNGGTITDAVSSQVWSGEAVVHVAIVNWIRGILNTSKTLSWQVGNDPNKNWFLLTPERIPSSLSSESDVTKAKDIRVNKRPKRCFQGQTHGSIHFLVPVTNRGFFGNLESHRLFPFLTADELIGNVMAQPQRMVIDVQDISDAIALEAFPKIAAHLKETVLIERRTAAEKEAARNIGITKPNRHHQNFLGRWWQLSWPRPELISELSKLSRFVVCGQVTKRPIFEFISTNIRPNAALIAFTFDDDYSFGILQSNFHWEWFKARCSTLTERFRYTSESIYESFPWPQNPSQKHCEAIANAARALRHHRNSLLSRKMTFRTMYRTLESEGKNSIRDLHTALDKAVQQAYGFEKGDILANLLELNGFIANSNDATPPGLPDYIKNRDKFVEDDCIKFLG